MKNILLSSILSFLFVALHGQSGCEIQVTIAGYSYDTLWFGHTVGKRAEPEFFSLRQADGSFLLKSDASLPQGMYALIMRRGPGVALQHTPCWLADGQRRFSVQFSYIQMNSTIVFTGSPENEILYDYLKHYQEMTDRLDAITDNWKEAPDQPEFIAKVGAEQALQQYQTEFIRMHPGTLTAKLVEQTIFPTPPAPKEPYKTWQEEAEARHQWQKNHYFDRTNLATADFLRQPLWLDRTDFYVTKLSPPNPDSMIVMLESVFKQLEPNVEGYQYYMRYMLNSLSRMSRFRTDEVFVYFVRKYVDTGKTNWIEESENYRYQAEASRMEPLFVGKKAPDLTLYDKDNKEVSLYGVEAPYTILVFWRYDCSHCNKEIPILKRVYEKLKSKGLKVMSVCGNSGDNILPKCWQFAERIGMPAEWYLLADPGRRSRFPSVMNVSGYPRLFLMDANKTILYKQGGEASEKTMTRMFEEVMK